MEEIEASNVEDIISNSYELKELASEFEIEKEIAEESNEKSKLDFHNNLEFKNYNGEDKVISTTQILKKMELTGYKIKTYYTGYTRFDAICGGFDEGELNVLSGITGNGKTLLARSLTYKFALEIPCLWFSYEETNEALLNKFHRNNTPVFYIPKKNVASQIKWIENRIIESKIKYGCKIVFIDHLHFLIPMKYVINTSVLIGGIMRELKSICVRNNMVIFLICHTQKVAQMDLPDLSQLRDSSFIAQESDKVMFIKRHGKEEEDRLIFDNNNSVYILKNRKNGNLGTVSFFYNYEEGILNENTI